MKSTQWMLRALMKQVYVGIVVLLMTLCISPFSQAQQIAATNSDVVVPPLVNFTGVLTDVNGKALTEITGVTFYLYKDQEGGAPLWMETQNVTPNKAGHYTVMLGSTSSHGLPADLFASGEARWLGVQAQGQPEQPRVMLLSVPYALKAKDAETLGGKPASAFLVASSATTDAAEPTLKSNAISENSSATAVLGGTGTTNYLPKWTSSTNLGVSKVFQSTAGDIGIGTTTPAAALDVKGAINASTGFDLGGKAFASGSYSKENAFLGFSGNSTMTGTSNTASGLRALSHNSTGYQNTASG
jgi:hypothetical protein